VAPGKLVVSDQSKIIQPLEAGVVKAIYVRAGDLLIELDSTLANVESHKNHTAWLDARLDVLRAQALIQALKNHTTPQLADDAELAMLPGIASRRAAAQQGMLSSWQELQTKLATVDADTTRKQAERNGTQDQVNKLTQTLPIMRLRENDYKNFVAKNFMSKHSLLDKEQAPENLNRRN
jgi:hemolysin D